MFSLPVESFVWEPAELVNCEPDCGTLDLVPISSATYTLDAISLNGCEATDSIYVEVNTVRKVYIPNAFSPNSDGFNDYFTVFGAIPNVQQIDHLMIFDRWGGMLFENMDFLPNDESAGWDGKARGKALQTGPYTYWARVRFLDDTVLDYSGSIALIR